MILNAYSLLDTKSGVFSPPWFLIHDAVAIRAVREIASNRETTPGQYPDDFVLYGVGTFDDNLGSFHSYAPRNLGVVSSLLVRRDVVSEIRDGFADDAREGGK